MNITRFSLGLLGLMVTAPTVLAGGVYSMTNAADGNRVMAYHRADDGGLTPIRSYRTGGLGTGDGLGNQGALALSQNNAWLYVVNPGSDSLSAFAVDSATGELRLLQTRLSAGDRPVSVAVFGDLLYVLNAGSDSLKGFRIALTGKLSPLRSSERPLSGGGVGAAQVQFSRDGRTLVVTEKATNRIVSFPVNAGGHLGEMHIAESATPTPFGFAFGRRNQMFVTQAAGGSPGASTLAAYKVGNDSALTAIGDPVPVLQTAACWVTVSLDNRYAWTTNTPDDSIAAFELMEDGRPQGLVDSSPEPQYSGLTALPSGSRPVDLAVSDDNRYLYSLNTGTHTIGRFHIEPMGFLTPLSNGASNLPTTMNGLAAF